MEHSELDRGGYLVSGVWSYGIFAGRDPPGHRNQGGHDLVGTDRPEVERATAKFAWPVSGSSSRATRKSNRLHRRWTQAGSASKPAQRRGSISGEHLGHTDRQRNRRVATRWPAR